MLDGTLYYCWSCDAHRRVSRTTSGPPACPRCRQELSEDSRLKVRLPVSPAPQAVFAMQAQQAGPRELRSAS